MKHDPRAGLKELLVGAVIGITSMLPGISGATMAVVFGIYERLIRDIAELKTYLRKDLRFLLLVIIGAAIGFLLCAKVLDGVLNDYPVECLMFFLGLILGQLIPLYKGTRFVGKGKFTRNDYIAFVVGFAIMMSMVILDFVGEGDSVTVADDAGGVVLMFIIGVIVAVSALLPGLSHSTILLVSGLMDAFVDVFADMDLVLVIPLVVGVVAGALGFSKVIDKALKEYRLTTLVFILALTVGSVVVIGWTIAGETEDAVDVCFGAVCLVIGFLAALGCMKLDRSDADEESD